MIRPLSLILAVTVCVLPVGCRKSRPAPPVEPPTAEAAAAAASAPSGPPIVSTAPGVALRPTEAPVEMFDITTALRGYVAAKQLRPSTITDLSVLVPHYLAVLPPPPPGKKYVWDKYLVVTLENK